MAYDDIFSLNASGGSMLRHSVPPALKAVCAAMQEHLSDHRARGVDSASNTYMVFPISGNLDATTIIVAVTHSNVTLYRTLVLGSTVLGMPARTEKLGQASWSVPGMPGDVITDTFHRTVAEIVRAQMPANHRVVALGATMLDTRLDINDSMAMVKIADEAIKAAEVAIAEQSQRVAIEEAKTKGLVTPSFPPLGMRLSLLQEGDTLLIETRFNDDVCRGADGAVYRRSWSLALFAKRNGGGGVAGARQIPLAMISGYTDFQWDASNGIIDPTRPGYSTDGKKLTCRYLPNHIITCVDTGSMPSTEMALLALGAAPLIVGNRRWLSQFFNSHNGDQNLMQWRDLGGLGIEGLREPNSEIFGPKIELGSNMVNEAVRMVNDLVNDNSVFSIAISRTGFDQVTLQGLAAALSLNEKSDQQRTAWARLVTGANNLTGGKFGGLMSKNGLDMEHNWTVQDGVNDYYVPIGHLTAAGGGQYVTQDVDYLTLAAVAGEQFPDILRKWTDTQNVNEHDWPPTRRLAMMITIIQEALPGMRLTVTDIGRHARLGSNFMNCLSEAIRDSISSNGIRLEFPDDVRFSVGGQGRANSGNAGYVNAGVFANSFNQPQRSSSGGLAW